ncbi:MAG TPA: efflux RND transporter periplasmic adaptor subunit [Bacteroidota bacterium]
MTENQTADLSSLRINRDPSYAGPPKSRLYGRLGIAAGILAVAVTGYFLIGSALDPAVEVQLTTVAFSSPSQANAVLTASGFVVAQRKAAVASKGTGRLEFLGVVEGDKVTKNQILARIESADIQAQLDQARANLRLSEAELHDAQQSLERQRTLLEKGLSTQAEYDGAEARHRRVLASIEVARAAVAGAGVAMENTLIRAPFDGTVLTKNADVGEMVAPMAASAGSRSAVVTIADMSSLEVEADVSESNIERIQQDQPCEITLDAYPDVRYQGYVKKIVPTADRAKATVMVKVGFRSYDSRVLPEMSAKVLFLTQAPTAEETSAKPVLTVSASAVVSRGSEQVVYTVNENKAVEVPVEMGKTMGSVVEILAGLSAGNRVIANVPDEIRDGTAVKVK